MDETYQKFAYRCLPLNIANCFGWEILCPTSFVAEWQGSELLDGVDIKVLEGREPPALSHFGHGIITFHIPVLFKTKKNTQLMVQGPINSPKDGIYPLTGIIETDWSPYTFTMNWKFTRPGKVLFAKEEPICHIFPVNCDQIEDIDPYIDHLDNNPELKEQFEIWRASRTQFNEDLKIKPVDKGWQRSYFKGLDSNGNQMPEHRTKLRLKIFKNIS